MITKERTSPISVKKFEGRINFSIKKNVSDSLVLVDKENRICLLKWHGRVDEETASQLLIFGGASVLRYGCTKVIVDRSKLIEFDSEARLWIDNWIKTKAQYVSTSVKKIALINTKNSLFNNIFNSTIGLIFPTIRMKKFDDGYDAMEWVKN